MAVALINMAIARPRWPPKIINLVSAGLFVVLTLIGFLGNRSINGWLVDWASGLVASGTANRPTTGFRAWTGFSARAP